MITTFLYGRNPKSKCYCRLRDRFVGVSVPSISKLYRGVNKFESTSLAKKKRERKRRLCYSVFRNQHTTFLKTVIPENGITKPSAHASTEFRKGKAVPLQAWSGPEGSRKLRFPDYMTTAQDGGKVVSLTHRPPLPPGNTPGINFC